MNEPIKGPKGGLYYIVNGKKKYIKKIKSKKKSISMDISKTNTRLKKEKWNNSYDKISSKIKYCCCCGKPLTKMDIELYDLESYCIDCAIADGIRTSK